MICKIIGKSLHHAFKNVLKQVTCMNMNTCMDDASPGMMPASQ